MLNNLRMRFGNDVADAILVLRDNNLEQLVFSACSLLFMFYVVTQNLWDDTDRL